MSESLIIEAEIKGYVNKGISKVTLEDGGDLVFTLTDGTVKNLGRVKGDKGEIPVYTLIIENAEGEKVFSENEESENAEVLTALSSLEKGSYILLLDTGEGLVSAQYFGESGEYLFPVFEGEAGFYKVSFWDGVYSRTFEKKVSDGDFDEDSTMVPTMKAVADYVKGEVEKACYVDSEVMI